MKIPFNRPSVAGNELQYLQEALQQTTLAGNGPFNRKCAAWLEQRLGVSKALMTSSCTDALEMAALVAGIQPGDEVILPSYTFVTSASAFALRGARLVFVDVRPDTMNLDEQQVLQAITPQTRAIVVVHYAGVPCEMDTIVGMARERGILVIEDAAQALMSTYDGQPAGALGDMAAFSFHETKNYSCGEGGALTIRNKELVTAAEIVQEKGTDRAAFFRGQVDKYSWKELGSSFLMSELQAAYLYAQFEQAEQILDRRMQLWNTYYDALKPLADKGVIELPKIPDNCTHNAHLFFLKLADLETRQRFIAYLSERNIVSVFHYVPLHSSPAGLRHGRFHGEDHWTTRNSERLTRLPLFSAMTDDEAAQVVVAVQEFFEDASAHPSSQTAVHAT